MESVGRNLRDIAFAASLQASELPSFCKTADFFCGSAGGLGLHKQDGERLLHGHSPPVFHGEAIPEMILVGHGLEQVHAGLMLQGDVALQFREELLLELAYSALAFEQVADKEQRQRAKTEEGRAKCPIVANGMEEHQRVHEHGQSGRLHENEGSGENGELA